METDMNIQKYSEKELKRMKEVFSKLKVKSKSQSKKAGGLLEFAKNYYNDGIYFSDKGQFIEAFEAFIISWAYVDIGLKLGLFEVPDEIKRFFTA